MPIQLLRGSVPTHGTTVPPSMVWVESLNRQRNHSPIVYLWFTSDLLMVYKWFTRGLPAVAHKAVAEVSRIDNYRRGELLWCMDGRANPLMDRKVVGVVLFGMVAVVNSPTTAQCSVPWCGVVYTTPRHTTLSSCGWSSVVVALVVVSV